MKTVKKFKLWSVWQDDEQEAWLQRMAAQGLHLRARNALLGVYTFERGAPARMAYRWDMSPDRFDPAYQRLLEDAGWERVAVSEGRYCWRKPLGAGETAEIFTDPAEKRRKYQRLLLPCVAMAVMQVVMLLQWSDWGRAPLALTALNWLSLGIGLIAAYSAVRLGQRIAALKAA